MAIINRSSSLYTPPPVFARGALSFAATVAAHFTPRIRSPFVRGELGFSVTAKAKFRARSRTERGILLRARVKAKFSGQRRLLLTMPEPILPTSANFRNGFLTARLFQNNVSIPVKAFTVNAPKDSLSMAISVQVAGFERDLINPAGSFKFQIGHKAAKPDAWTWFTIADGAKLQSKNFDIRFPGDSISFVASAEDNAKLQTAPPCPRVVYDSRKIELSDSEVSKLYTENGLTITTQLINVAHLTLYKLLHFAFVDGCGFSSVQTDIPNYEISRLDFPLTATYLEAMDGVLKLWKPLITSVGDTLRIQKKTTVPNGFTPAQLPPEQYINYSENLSGRADVDGIILDYGESSAELSIHANRTETTSEETGVFGETNFTRTDIIKQIRDYKKADQPYVIYKSEIVSETRSTYDWQLNLIARETETHTLDRQGKRTTTAKASDGLVPNLSDGGGSLALLRTREELTSFSYKPDPKNVRRSLQNRTVTQIRGIIAIDAENPYFDQPFRQDFTEAHKAGNLKDGMTADFGAVKTVTETLQTLGNGQTQINVQTMDHLRNTITNSLSETRAGESALTRDGQNSRQMVIYKSGYTKRKKHATLSVGELPLFFALPLAKLELDRILNGETAANLEIAGFDENLTCGTYLEPMHRNGDGLGLVLTEGFTIEGANLGTREQRVTTKIEAALIKRED